MDDHDRYNVKLFCFRFYNEFNSKYFTSDIFNVTNNIRSEIVKLNGFEIFETTKPVFLSSNSGDNKTLTKEIIEYLAEKFILISNEQLLKFNKHEDGLFVVSVNGRAYNRDGTQFGVFRQLIQFNVDNNKKFTVKNLISKIVSTQKVMLSGETEESYFPISEL